MDVGELIKYLLTPVAQVALIIGIAELMKRVGVASRFIPLIDLGLGLVSGICVYGIAMEYGMVDGIILGIALGLSACGLFSGIKNVSQPQWTFNNDSYFKLTEDGDIYENEDNSAKG